jgi:LysR family glycine cleavage system transcriptional activator
VPLIHDESLSSRAAIPTWADWFQAAGVRGADISRGLRFSSADHALDATAEGAGVLLAFDALAYDDLRTGRLVMPFDLALPSGRCYAFVCPKKWRDAANVQVFRVWLRQEAVALDWIKRPSRAAEPSPAAGSSALNFEKGKLRSSPDSTTSVGRPAKVRPNPPPGTSRGERRRGRKRSDANY